MEKNFKKIIEESIQRTAFKKLNLKDDPFYTIVDRTDLFIVDRQREQSELARAIVNLISEKTQHVSILGGHGSGKTHLLRYFYEQIKNSDELKSQLKIDEIYFISGILDFRDFDAEDSSFSQNSKINMILTEKEEKKNKRILLFIDDMDIIASRLTRFIPRLFDAFAYSIVGSWNKEEWMNTKNIAGYRIPKPETVVLRPLKEEDAMELLNRRLQKVQLEDKPKLFTNDILLQLVRSVGPYNPYRLLTFSHRYLNYLIDKNEIPNTQNLRSFLESARLLSFETISSEVNSLDKRDSIILQNVYQKTEISAEELANYLKLSRVAARSLLENLVKKNLLERRRKGHVVFYFIPEDIEEMINIILNSDENLINKLSKEVKK